MGLNMVVGVLVGNEDDEYPEAVRVDFTAIGELLERVAARHWSEPDLNEAEGGEFQMWGYSGLHALQPSTR